MTATPALDTTRLDDIDLGKPRAVRIINYLPPYFQDDPQVRAFVCAAARELDRIEAAAVALRAGAFPRTADTRTLAYYERLFGLSSTGLSLDQRRTDVLAHFRKRSVASRLDWQAALEAFIASPGNWSYAEVPTYQINLTVPVDPAGIRVPLITAFARAVTPAHLTLVVNGSYGAFQIGISHIGDIL